MTGQMRLNILAEDGSKAPTSELTGWRRLFGSDYRGRSYPGPTRWRGRNRASSARPKKILGGPYAQIFIAVDDRRLCDHLRRADRYTALRKSIENTLRTGDLKLLQ
jgi:hypothetical protein